MERQASRNKYVPQKRKAESNESDIDYLFPEVIDNDTGNDPPNDNAAAEESKEGEHDTAENITQVPKKNPAPDGDDASSSSFGLVGDGEGVGGNAGSGGRRSHTPDQGIIHSSAEPILRLLTRLGIEKHYAIRMINVEQFHNENDLVELDDNHIHSIYTVNLGNEKDVDTYISGTGDYNLHLAVFVMKHLKFTGHSFHPDRIGKSFVMTFKDQKKRVETHVRSEVNPPVIKK